MDNLQTNLNILLDLFTNYPIDEILLAGVRPLALVGGPSPSSYPTPFPSPSSLARWIQALARRDGIRLDPLCGGAGGVFSARDETYRWHCVLPPLAPDGPLVSIRRHRFTSLSVADFRGREELKAAASAAAAARRHLVIIGPTGAGKTTLLAALLREQAVGERIIAIESVPELPCLTPGWLRLLERRPNLEGVGAVSTLRLVQEALRLRPDRLVIGEVRGPEASALLTALMSGHGGVLTTLHAGSPQEAVRRLRHLAAADGWAVGDGSSAKTSVSDLNLTVIQLGRGGDGGPPSLLAVDDATLHLG